ncbi:sulfotransferase family 2 domain-containing protein [Flammeovirgaceae bacterium SG7u.111]|nr:sulfotransferase family 2 domain-containing protein [Flammeovirgaceae bacterium SG7u.132]WPO37131.1 sulfotransferase family 2 domain-containing protein [Flammeovirgaceae bacterium SG7u.111]
MISHTHKYIYIHIPKTGGKSLYKILPDAQHNRDALPKDNTINIGRRKMHLNVTEIQKALGVNKFNEYFKFAFVRNPWDRVVSEFFWRKSRPNRIQFNTIYEMLQFIENGNYEIDDLNRHLAPQYEMICDSSQKKLLIDYVANFENFTKEIHVIFTKIGIETPNIIPQENKSIRSTDYNLYLKKQEKRLIEKIYEKDITLFDYISTK